MRPLNWYQLATGLLHDYNFALVRSSNRLGLIGQLLFCRTIQTKKL